MSALTRFSPLWHRPSDLISHRTTVFIFQTTKALIEGPDDESDTLRESELQSSRAVLVSSKTAVVFVPARDEADELVVMMLSQLVKRDGVHGSYIAIGMVSEMLKGVSQESAK
jgi:hypothetical protein